MPVRLLLAATVALSLHAPARGHAPPAPDEPKVVRAWFSDLAQVRQVSALLGHAQVDADKGLLRTEADAALLDALQRAGFRVEIDVEASERVASMQRAMQGEKSIPGYACYRTVEETEDDMAALAGAYPHLLRVVDIGSSWQALERNAGYRLRTLVASNQTIAGPKPALFLVASIHAREYTPAELATRFIEDLVLGYGRDAEATWLLDHHEIHALLQGNPDGRKMAESGLSWRKNHNTDHCGSGSAPGVDLNRNYPFAWGAYGGSSGNECALTYRGPVPASEPETTAVTDYVRALFPDRRGEGLNDPAPDDTQGLFIDIHSFSRLVLWPWGFTSNPAPNGAALAKLGRRLAWFNDYTAEQAIGLYATDGTTEDFAYGELGVPAYTFELGTAFFQDCASFEDRIEPDNAAALRYAARTLAAPYRLPFGPDVFELRTEPDLALVGEPVTVHATLDDARMQTRVTGASGPVPAVQAVASASAYPLLPPWQDGATPLPMQAADGAFDSSRESAHIELDTAALGAGRHLVYVQGRDAAGNDGPPNAAFVELVEPEQAVRLQGEVRAAGSGLPLAATVRSGRFVAQSDAELGRYQRILPPGSFDLEVTAPGFESELRFALPGPPGSRMVQNFRLTPLCNLLTDPAEPGVASPFIASPPWTIRAGLGSDGGGAWLPTAGDSYAHNLDTSLTGPVVDLTGYHAPELHFDSRCDSEAGYDFGRVEVSTNGGSSWSEVFRCDGETAWRRVELPLPALAGEAQARLRFRFSSDSIVSASGWAIDNISLRAGGPACAGQHPDTSVLIERLGASPAVIASGASTLVAWQTRNAEACWIGEDGDAEPAAIPAKSLASGSLMLFPSRSARIVLRCEGEDSEAETGIEVSVTGETALLRDGFEGAAR